MEMENQKKNTGLYVIIAILCVLVIGLGGYIVSSKLLDKKQESQNVEKNPNEQKNTDETKTRLSDSELNILSDYFDVYKNNENSLMEFISFSNPNDLLNKNAKNIANNLYYLQMILSESKYSQQLDSEYVRISLISLSGIKSQLKDLTNYDYRDEDIKDYFSQFYKKDKNVFEINSPGGAAMTGTISSSYKIGNKYYVTLSNNINIVLQKVNNQYYFYSSTGLSE